MSRRRTAGADGTTPANQQEIATRLMEAIKAYNKRRVELLKAAFDAGDEPSVAQLEDEYQTLRDAYYDTIRARLDANNARYETLTKTALEEADSLTKTIEGLADAAKVITAFSTAINAVGRMLIVLGVTR